MRDFADFPVKVMVLDAVWQSAEYKDDPAFAPEARPPYARAVDWLVASHNIDSSAASDVVWKQYFCKPIPEIEQWVRDIDFSEATRASVRRLLLDGGLTSQMLISPSWDGEDDLFWPKTWTDITRLNFPNLETLIAVSPISPEARAHLAAQGIEVS